MPVKAASDGIPYRGTVTIRRGSATFVILQQGPAELCKQAGR